MIENNIYGTSEEVSARISKMKFKKRQKVEEGRNV